MPGPSSQWVLAFNSSCQKCRTISASVAAATNGRLDVLPLARPDVVRWRLASLGPDAPFAPTLLQVGPDVGKVRGWTGIAMAIPLVRRLGLRTTIAVMNELGQLKYEQQDSGRRAMSRKGFLRLGAGAGVAIGLMVAGQTPSFAEGEADVARKWVEANLDHLPQTYDAVLAHPPAYRQAILLRLPDDAQERLWMEQLNRYRTTQPDLLPEQEAALTAAVAFLSKGLPAIRADQAQAARLNEELKKAFGPDEARALVAQLGPGQPSAEYGTSTVEGNCECNYSDDWCAWGWDCELTTDCSYTSKGCGIFNCCHCSGMCR